VKFPWATRPQVFPAARVRMSVKASGGPPLKFNIEVISAPHVPDQDLLVSTVEPDSATARALPFLASWATAGTLDEINGRDSISLSRRIRRARFESKATLEGFDFTASPKLPADPRSWS
jgi:hypothetical protein